jgi:secreted PhoX family phosphatase
LFRSASALASLWAAGRPAAALAATATRPLVRDPKRIVDLPPGFSYRVLSRRGDRMSDGYRVPACPDAMGVFQSGGALVLMRNHEVTPGDHASGPYPPGRTPPPEAYDPDGFGGVTRLVLDPQTLALRSSNLALCGTHWNCAGGSSPWGWLSCEEIFSPDHGYVFLCSTESSQLRAAERIAGYGHFRHEAASVDPRTHIAYLSEDREDAAFYRFKPERLDQPFQGQLQALRVRGQPQFDTNRMLAGDSLEVDWVDVPQPDSAADDVRLQAQAHGAARFVRTEGLCLGERELFFCATSGGPIGRGQIFRLTLGEREDEADKRAGARCSTSRATRAAAASSPDPASRRTAARCS